MKYMKYLEVKRINRYVRGVVGQDIRLSLTERIRLLFLDGLSVALIEPSNTRQGKVEVPIAAWNARAGQEGEQGNEP